MKKYLIGTLAVAFAIVSFAFTPKYFNEGLQCNTTLYWFKVKSTVANQACSQIVQDELTFVEDADDSETPNEVEQKTGAQNPYGCQDQSNACSLGYTIDQLELVQIGSSFFYRPISSQVSSFKCCVYRP